MNLNTLSRNTKDLIRIVLFFIERKIKKIKIEINILEFIKFKAIIINKEIDYRYENLNQVLQKFLIDKKYF